MNKEKWKKITQEEVQKHINRTVFMEFEPENWEEYKKANLEYIKEVDKATEVYFMENKK